MIEFITASVLVGLHWSITLFTIVFSLMVVGSILIIIIGLLLAIHFKIKE